MPACQAAVGLRDDKCQGVKKKGVWVCAFAEDIDPIRANPEDLPQRKADPAGRREQPLFLMRYRKLLSFFLISNRFWMKPGKWNFS